MDLKETNYTRYEVWSKNNYPITGSTTAHKAIENALEWAEDYPDKADFPFKLIKKETSFVSHIHKPQS